MSPVDCLTGILDPTTGTWDAHSINFFLILHSHVICWPLRGYIYPMGGRRVFAISDTWPNQRSLLSLVSWDKMPSKHAANIRFSTCTLFTRSFRSTLAALRGTGDRWSPSDEHLYVAQPRFDCSDWDKGWLRGPYPKPLTIWSNSQSEGRLTHWGLVAHCSVQTLFGRA